MNPSAREVLEAERKKCYQCYHGYGARFDPMYLCPTHRGVLHGIELAERADLERVVSVLEGEMIRYGAGDVCNYDGTFSDGDADTCNPSDYTAIRAIADAIESLRAEFPEVKEGSHD